MFDELSVFLVELAIDLIDDGVTNYQEQKTLLTPILINNGVINEMSEYDDLIDAFKIAKKLIKD